MTVLKRVNVEYITFFKDIVRCPRRNAFGIASPFREKMHASPNEAHWDNGCQSFTISRD